MTVSWRLGRSRALVLAFAAVALDLAAVQPAAAFVDPFRSGAFPLQAFKCPDLLSFLIPNALYCQLCRTAVTSGQVSDCSCDFETVDAATHAYFHPLLTQLQTTPFFRFFKVHLDEA